MPAHTFTQSAALVQVCTPVENNSKLWRSQTLDVSNSSPNPTASTSSEVKSCQGSWNRLDCFHPTARRQRKPAKKRDGQIQQVGFNSSGSNASSPSQVIAVQLQCWSGLVGMELMLLTAARRVQGSVSVLNSAVNTSVIWLLLNNTCWTVSRVPLQLPHP